MLAPLVTRDARADEIPIVTLTDVGPNQDIPTHHAFYVTGDAPPTAENVQAIVVRRGTPGIFSGDDPDCHDVIADLRMDMSSQSASDADDDENEDGDTSGTITVRYDAGVHRAFELFPRAESDSRASEVLVSAAWQRIDDNTRTFKVLVPHDPEFFSTGYWRRARRTSQILGAGRPRSVDAGRNVFAGSTSRCLD